MKKILLALSVLVVAPAFSSTSNPPMAGTIVSESSVYCGTKKQGKKESTALLCKEYTVRTNTTEYKIRQEKPADKSIVPANTPIEFTLNKNKMKFKANGKKYEYLIVATSALDTQTK